MSILGTGHLIQKLKFLVFWKIYSGWRDVRWTPWFIKNMMAFWKLVFMPGNWLLTTLCDTLKTSRENHWFLRIKQLHFFPNMCLNMYLYSEYMSKEQFIIISQLFSLSINAFSARLQVDQGKIHSGHSPLVLWDLHWPVKATEFDSMLEFRT